MLCQMSIDVLSFLPRISVRDKLQQESRLLEMDSASSAE